MDYQAVKQRLHQLNIHPQKKWGQNFLINVGLAYQITSLISDLHPRKIIEIGPGLGSLTELLIQLNIPLQVVEVDPVLCDFWKKRKLDVIQENALNLNKNIYLKEACTLVGNLPYHISSTLIIEASVQWKMVESMVLMMQKEVAQRILSPSQNRNFSLISVIVQCLWTCQSEVVARVSDFYPQPKVDGQVIVFKRKPSLDISLEDFLKFLQICFAQKRKLLKRKLEGVYGKDLVAQVFTDMNLNLLVRAEAVTSEQYLHLFRFITT